MKAEYKVPGGKLLACEITLKEFLITDIKISGDFFMHPETVILDLEAALKGTTTLSFPKKIHNFFKGSEITLFGVSPQDFTTVIQLAIDSE